jgi:hypothetical protein
VFTSLFVTAMLLGHRSGTILDRSIAGLVASLSMVPCRMLLPRLYRSANAPPALSKTSLRQALHTRSQATRKTAATRDGPGPVAPSRALAMGASRAGVPGAVGAAPEAPAGPMTRAWATTSRPVPVNRTAPLPGEDWGSGSGSGSGQAGTPMASLPVASKWLSQSKASVPRKTSFIGGMSVEVEGT